MAFKRKLCVGEIEGDAEKKRARMEEDRVSNLPDDLKLRILTFLDTKDVFKTSMLSKTWVSFWNWIPVLDFNDYAFQNLNGFDKFVDRVLFLRDPSAKLDRLTFTRRLAICSPKILKDVFAYALSHGVKQLEADIYKVNNSRNLSWPVCLYASFESLTSLKLQSGISMSCPFLGPRSGSFKNLTDLYLSLAIITDHDPFSGFPVLERLTLVNCDIGTEDETLHVQALNLSDLYISGCHNFKACELTTPRLRFFEYRGGGFNILPLFRRHNMDFHVLDTMVIDCGTYIPRGKRAFDNMFSLFCTFGNVKSLELCWSTVEILSMFRAKWVKRSSPFRKLKCLKLKFRYGFVRSLKSTKIAADVKAYLLQNSPEAEVMCNI